MSRRDESHENPADGPLSNAESPSRDAQESEDAMLNAFDSTPYQVAWTSDGHATEESVYAWLDGALGDTESDAINGHVRACAQCSAVVAQARGFIAASVRIMNAADLLPQNTQRNVVSQADVSRAAAHIVALADAVGATAGSAPLAGAAAQIGRAHQELKLNTRSGRTWHQGTVVRAAAVALLMVGATYALTRTNKEFSANGTTNVATQADSVTQGKLTTLPDTVLSTKPTVVATIAPVDSTDHMKARADAPGGVAPARKTERAEELKFPSARVAVAAAAAVRPAAPSERPTVTLPGVTVQASNDAQAISKSTFAVTPAPKISDSVAQRNIMASATPPSHRDTTGRRTITGNVKDRATSTPLGTANVFILGTPLTATTDAAGNFTLANVPASATDLEVKRLGYGPSKISIASISEATGAVNVQLEARPMMLDQVTVAAATDAQSAKKSTFATTRVPSESMPSAGASPVITPLRTPGALCLSAMGEPPNVASPLVRNVRSTKQKAGVYDATLTGWPNARDEKRVLLTDGADGVLRGTVRAGEGRLDVELTPRAGDWISTLSEHRGANVRTENVRFMRDTVSTKCRQ